jgi:hypothetical protein
MARTSSTTTGSRGGGKHQTFDAAAASTAYSPGAVLFFPQVRHWLDKGNLVEAYGKVLSVQKFDNEVPYITVSFDDAEVKELNQYDLGRDPRNFLIDIK